MSPAWNEGDLPVAPPITFGGWLRVILRGGALAVVVFGGLVLLLALRLIERPVFGLRRPVTPGITIMVCRLAVLILGLQYSVRGRRMTHHGAVVANHASWLDIFVLNARKRVYFVAKAEVARWPGIGWLARSTGTVFITRRAAEAKSQNDMFAARLKAGHRLLFFPEGTSTDGKRVLPFKSTLFESFFAPDLREFLYIQPVTINYYAPRGQESRFYGWWADMGFGPHLLKVLAAPHQGGVELVYHPPLRVADFDSRKALAQACASAVRSGLDVTG